MLTPANIEEYKRRFALRYHVGAAAQAEAMVGLRGRRVLEVGGSLPEGFVREALEVGAWIAIEEAAYWHEIGAGGAVAGGAAPQAAARRFKDATPADLDAGYSVFAGRAEHLPERLRGRFDVAFSLSAFEHIDRLALTLDAIHAALRPGGKLFAMFSPVWSAHDGHHLPNIRDAAGRVFNYHASPIPPWGHLLMRPPELFQHLLAHTDRQTAAEIVYYVYHSSHINRLMTEDYVAYVQASPFEVELCEAIYPNPPPADIEAELRRQYPRHAEFANNGLLLVLRKPGEGDKR
jgi:SAM-dependent methyltransferase